MSDQPEEHDGTADEVTEQPLGAWSEPAGESAWAIEDQPESAAPGPAGPGAPPQETPTDVQSEAASEALPEPATEVQPATEAGRSRRPTSLRDQYVKSDESMPRRTLSPPPFPSQPSIPGSPVAPPVSGSGQPGNPAWVTDTGHTDDPGHSHDPGHTHDPTPPPSLKERLDKLPLDKLSPNKLPLDKLSFSNLPLDKLSRKPSSDGLPPVKLPTDKLPVEKLRTLTKQRPEVGLGLAFAGGLVIATMLKRLGRR